MNTKKWIESRNFKEGKPGAREADWGEKERGWLDIWAGWWFTGRWRSQEEQAGGCLEIWIRQSVVPEEGEIQELPMPQCWLKIGMFSHLLNIVLYLLCCQTIFSNKKMLAECQLWA